MPPTDAKPAVNGRTRLLLIVLGVVAAGALMYGMWPAAEPSAASSNQTKEAPKSQATAGARAPLEVRLDDLKQPPPGPGETTRNPFRFYVKPPAPPPPKPAVNPGSPAAGAPGAGQRSFGPPPPPPITIKFIGVLEVGTKKVAIFSDDKGLPIHASEGQTVLGQYKLLKIGVESVTMSYLDGRGVQTIPMRGGKQ